MIEDSGELFSFELEKPVFHFGRTSYWFDIEILQPELLIDGNELYEFLSQNNLGQSEHFEKLKKQKVSKFVLTFGRTTTKNLGYEYAVGFWDGKQFKDLDGYGLYPPPTHWVHFPNPPVNSGEIFLEDNLFEN